MKAAASGCIGPKKIPGQKNAPSTIAQNASAAKMVSSTFIRPSAQAVSSQAIQFLAVRSGGHCANFTAGRLQAELDVVRIKKITTWIMFSGKLDIETDIPAPLAGLTICTPGLEVVLVRGKLSAAGSAVAAGGHPGSRFRGGGVA